jgi:succinate-semialdehyde dehydrogenase/glutarate-semialdehyde dehydrogenase
MAMAYGALEAPFGGRKNSGLGQVNGQNGLLNYTFQQSVIVDTWGGFITSTHYPYSLAKDEGMKKFMRFLWASPFGRLFT